MARLKKKPNYNPDTIMQELINEVSQLYLESGTKASIRQIADEFEMTPLKIRKLLITAGVFTSDICEQVQALSRSGESVPEIQRITGLSRASVHSYLPYSKIVYNAEKISQNAERIRVYRRRKAAVHSFPRKMKKCGNAELLLEELWIILKLFENYPFQDVKGFRFTYQVRETELYIVQKKTSIERDSVLQAVKRVAELNYKVNEPKLLETMEANYLYPLFQKIGLIRDKLLKAE